MAARSPGEIVKLLDDIPYFLMAGKLIPPLPVLNELLERGEYDAGMSGYTEWTPFAVDEGEYAAVVAALQARGMILAESSPPEDVDSYGRWAEWALAQRMGDDEAAEYLDRMFGLRRSLKEQIEACREKDEHTQRVSWSALIDVNGRISRTLLNWHERRRARAEADEVSPMCYLAPFPSGADSGPMPGTGKAKLTATIGNPETERWEDPLEIALFRQSDLLSKQYPDLPGFIRNDVQGLFVTESHEVAITDGVSAFITAQYAETGNALFLMVMVGGRNIAQVRSPAFYGDDDNAGFSIFLAVPGGDSTLELALWR